MTAANSVLSDVNLDSRELRNALGRFATGVTIVTTQSRDGRAEGLTVNSFSAVSLDPPLVLWSLRSASTALLHFCNADHFAVHVLATHQFALAQHFARSSSDKFSGSAMTRGLGNCPLIDDSLAIFECAVETVHNAGDHRIFIGRVLRAFHREGDPLIFNSGTYSTIKSTSAAVQDPI